MAGRLATVLVFLAAIAAPSAAQAADVVVFVCGRRDLCRTSPSRTGTKRITRAGAAGAYSRPSISMRGRRLAFPRGLVVATVYPATTRSTTRPTAAAGSSSSAARARRRCVS